MMKFKKLSTFLIAICFALSSFQLTNIHAASFSVGASTGSVDSNGSFTVTVSLNGAGLFTFSGSNASVSTSSEFCDSSCSFSVTAGSSGTASVTVTASDVTGYDESAITGSQSVSVAINSASGNNSSGGGSSNTPSNTNDNRSSDATLSSLVVSKGTLDPIFESGTTEYKITLAADVTALTIEATANDSSASVSGTGEQTVKPGDNALDVVVTAEDGSTKTYVINAYVDEKPTTFLKVNTKDYGVVLNVDSVSTPTGFEKTTIKIGDVEIPAWVNSITKMTLVYLLNEKSEKNFYIYENNEVVSIYKPMALLGYNLAVIDVPEDLQTRKGFTFTEVEVDGQKLPGWTFKNEAFANYSLIYVMNEKGEKVYFQYEKTTNTLQPYSGAASVTQEEYEQLTATNFMLLIGCIAGAAIAVLFLILWMMQIRRNKKGKVINGDDDNEVVVLPEEGNAEEPIESFTAPIANNGKEERPNKHRQAPQKRSEPVKKEEDFGTQPFRFHDDFDDK